MNAKYASIYTKSLFTKQKMGWNAEAVFPLNNQTSATL